MTQEEKAKAYDEVLERAQKATRAGSDVAMDIIQYIFPNINDSEDERIRKALIWHLKAGEDFVSNGVTKEQTIAWLEKQKDASKAIEAVDRIDKYIDWHVANAHDMKDSNPDKKYYRGWDDALGKMSGILQDVYSNEKQKEQKPNFHTHWENGSMVCEMKYYWKPTETDVALFNKAVTTNKALTPSERAQLDIIRSKFGCCRAVNCNGIMQKEQKSEQYSPLCNTIKDKIREYVTNHFVTDTIVKTDVKSIVKAMEEGVRLGKEEQKPWEWSEEDKRNLDRALFYVRDYQKNNGVTDGSKECVDWLKSLRPQYHGDVTMTEAYKMGKEAGEASRWKPSEEQIYSLGTVVKGMGDVTVGSVGYNLKELYEQLKKLM